MPTPEPGVYPGVSFDDYAAWDAVNHSTLVHFSKTPAHAYHASIHQEEKKATTLGHLVHTAVLEPELLEEEYLAAPKVDRRTKVGKAAYAQFEKEAEGRIIVTLDDLNCARAIKKNAYQHATFREFLTGKGANELSLLWIDPEFEVLCKARLDRLCEFSGQPYEFDVKTHGFVATRKSFESAIYKYGYHSQAAWYLRGAHILRPLPDEMERRFAWGVCETIEPYLVKVFDADDEALRMGADAVMSYLAQYAECKKTGVWPGWDQGMDMAGLPPWAMKGAGFDG